MLAIPFSVIGAIWLVYLLGYNMSVAGWVGIIALAGVDAETSVIMLLYLDQAFDKWRKEGRLRTIADLREAITEGAVKRIRPKNDDGHGNLGWIVADHVKPRRRSGRDEADRRADDRRRHQLVSFRADGVPCDL